jgi:apolipoprotein D and lipocalin family protein
MIRKALIGVGLLVPFLLAACQGQQAPGMATVDDLDLQRFMGDWYVIANIPTFIEKGAHNAVESYELNADGDVATTFSFREGGFDGPQKVYRPTGFVDPEDPAVWGMQFIWPIKAEFLVLFVDPDYQHTVIGRSARDYLWLMAREPQITDEAYEEMIAIAAASGYDVSRIERVPQRWGDGS